jgi:hypothetical protein
MIASIHLNICRQDGHEEGYAKGREFFGITRFAPIGVTYVHQLSE